MRKVAKISEIEMRLGIKPLEDASSQFRFKNLNDNIYSFLVRAVILVLLFQWV